MKLLAMPLAVLKLVGAALKLCFGFLLCLWFSLLVLCATPLWALELLFSRGAVSSLRLAALQNCDSYLDWLFSRSNPDKSTQHLTFVRLWGLEFQYR